MSSTRPLGPKGLPEVPPTRQPVAPSHASESHATEEAPALVADSVGKVKETVTTGRTHVAQADAKMLAELKAAIKDGTFKVNVDALAERLVADAFGED